MLSHQKSKCYLRMKGIPWNSTIQEVKDFLVDVDIEFNEHNLLLVKMVNGHDSGDCLLALNTLDQKMQCMEKANTYMGTRYIEFFPSGRDEWDRTKNRKVQPRKIPINENSFVVLMRGLPYSAHEDDCIAFFDDIHCLGVHLTHDNWGRPSGQGYAEFADKQSFRKALTYNRKHMQNRYIEIFKSNMGELKKSTSRNSDNQSRRAQNSRNRKGDGNGAKGANEFMTTSKENGGACEKYGFLPNNESVDNMINPPAARTYNDHSKYTIKLDNVPKTAATINSIVQFFEHEHSLRIRRVYWQTDVAEGEMTSVFVRFVKKEYKLKAENMVFMEEELSDVRIVTANTNPIQARFPYLIRNPHSEMVLMPPVEKTESLSSQSTNSEDSTSEDDASNSKDENNSIFLSGEYMSSMVEKIAYYEKEMYLNSDSTFPTYNMYSYPLLVGKDTQDVSW